MNTTPDFDKISQIVPMESATKLRCLAALRLACVGFALSLCALQLWGIGFWSAPADRALILGGLLIGLGRHADSIDPVRRSLGAWARLALIPLCAIVVLGNLLAATNPVWFASGIGMLAVFLCMMGYGLISTLTDWRRTARFRQMKRYLTTLPQSDRRAMRLRLEKNFKTLEAEGFR